MSELERELGVRTLSSGYPPWPFYVIFGIEGLEVEEGAKALRRRGFSLEDAYCVGCPREDVMRIEGVTTFGIKRSFFGGVFGDKLVRLS